MQPLCSRRMTHALCAAEGWVLFPCAPTSLSDNCHAPSFGVVHLHVPVVGCNRVFASLREGLTEFVAIAEGNVWIVGLARVATDGHAGMPCKESNLGFVGIQVRPRV